MALPPSLGAVQLIVADALPAEAAPMLGAPGAVSVGGAAGVTGLDSAERRPVPTALVALTWNLMAVPLVRPVTVRLVAPAPAGRSAPICALVAELTTLTE